MLSFWLPYRHGYSPTVASLLIHRFIPTIQRQGHLKFSLLRVDDYGWIYLNENIKDSKIQTHFNATNQGLCFIIILTARTIVDKQNWDACTKICPKYTPLPIKPSFPTPSEFKTKPLIVGTFHKTKIYLGMKRVLEPIDREEVQWSLTIHCLF